MQKGFVRMKQEITKIKIISVITILIVLLTALTLLPSPSEVQASIVFLPEVSEMTPSDLVPLTMNAGTTRTLTVASSNSLETTNWRIVSGATSGSSTTINEETGELTLSPGQLAGEIVVATDTPTGTITEVITVTASQAALTITGAENLRLWETVSLGLSQNVSGSDVNWSLIGDTQGTTINQTTGELTVGIAQREDLTILATVDGRTIIETVPVAGRFPDPETGMWWYVLVRADDPRGGIGNMLLITEYVHMPGTPYHNTIGFTSFFNSDARTNVENWFNNPANVGDTLRGMALDYEFQDADGNSIPRDPMVVGAGIEVDRADNTPNSEGFVVPKGTNVTRAHTRPILDSEGNGMAFILSTSEANEYFDNAAHRQALAAGFAHGAWWLRSPGHRGLDYYDFRHAVVHYDGTTGGYFATLLVPHLGFRPALWISVD